MSWVETHGLECLVIAYIFSSCTSVMPPMPVNLNWWATWLYNITQLLGANAGNLVKASPAGQQLETKLGVSQTKTLTATTSTEVTESPKV